MSWVSWVCLGMAVSGLVVFLYGANFYEAVVGWAGVGLFVVGILVFLVSYVFGVLTKKVDVEDSLEV